VVPLIVDRPDGKKKAYVRLTADHDALDVANKVRLSSPCPPLTRTPFCLSSNHLVFSHITDRFHINDRGSRCLAFQHHSMDWGRNDEWRPGFNHAVDHGEWGWLCAGVWSEFGSSR
jgi:hypothetical protein